MRRLSSAFRYPLLPPPLTPPHEGGGRQPHRGITKTTTAMPVHSSLNFAQRQPASDLFQLDQHPIEILGMHEYHWPAVRPYLGLAQHPRPARH